MSKQNQPISNRKLRRLEAVKARKLARKAGFPQQPAAGTAAAVAPVLPETPKPEAPAVAPDAVPCPEITVEPAAAPSVSAAQLEANRKNAKLSHGALTPETKAISAQNHTIHGMARHQNGNFKLLAWESADAFETLKMQLHTEHTPSTPTEFILVRRMAESDWLVQRAQRMQESLLDPATGDIKHEKKFSLYIRYQTTHTRAFHKCLNDLLKVRKEKHNIKTGVEAQRVESEKHEMKKELHDWEIMRKDALACQQLNILTKLKLDACREYPNFTEAYDEELAQRGFARTGMGLSARFA